MGGDQLVPAVAGDEVEREQGESLRAAWAREWKPLRAEVVALDGAHDLLVELGRRGHTLVLASSAQRDDLDHYVELLDAAELVQASTTADDVEATKPQPDVIQAALDRVDARPGAVMVGDTPWDCQAAGRLGVPSIGTLTGGFSAAELEEAGAVATFASLVDLRDALDDTPLGSR
jgi:HAD superfamily hydrolase (TIGR01549 family)